MPACAFAHECMFYIDTRRMSLTIVICSFYYLLQAPDERNYHIFYQLCSAAEQGKLPHLKLSELSLCIKITVEHEFNYEYMSHEEEGRLKTSDEN